MRRLKRFVIGRTEPDGSRGRTGRRRGTIGCESLESRVVLSTYALHAPPLPTGPNPVLATSGTFLASGTPRTFLAASYVNTKNENAPDGFKGGVDVYLGDGAGHFAGPKQYDLPGDAQPEGIVAGHFASANADDIAVVDDNNRLFLLKAVGDGTFRDAKSIGGLSRGHDLQLSYLSKAEIDGSTYLLLSYYSKDSVLIYKSDTRAGKLRLQGKIAHVNTPEQIAVADLDGDGHDDLAIADDGTTSVTIVKGKGHGRFGRAQAPIALKPATPTPGVDQKTLGIVADDLDGDNRRDLAVATTGSLQILGNTTTSGRPISFSKAAQVDYPGEYVVNVVAVDLGGAGHALAVTRPGSGRVSIIRNLGHFQFTKAEDVFSGPHASGGPVGLVLADLAGEGISPNPSLVLTNQGDNTVDILQLTP